MKLVGCFLIVLGLLSPPAKAAPVIEKGLLSSVLPNIEILFDSEQNLPVFVRVLRLAGDGECQEPGKQCEQALLYVVISDNEQLPVTSVTYRLDKAHSWDLRSVTECAGASEELCAKIALDQTLYDPVSKACKPVHRTYEFRMDSVKEVESK